MKIHVNTIFLQKKDINKMNGQENKIRQNMENPDVFHSVYARNCEIKRIDKPAAAAFLNEHHRYGDASCRFRYGIFLKRYTGHNLKSEGRLEDGSLVAVAEFSAGRKWQKGERTVRSYEWVRYASMTGVRVIGGMGKILETFIREHKPDDIMTYAIADWSEGDVYRKLGFELEGEKEFGESKSLKFRLKIGDKK